MHKIVINTDDRAKRFGHDYYAVYEVCPETDGMRFLASFCDKCYALEWANMIAVKFGVPLEEKKDEEK